MRTFIILFLLLAAALPLPAQQTKVQKKEVPASKARADAFPRITTTLGNVLSNTIARSKMQQLLDSSLHARDQFNHVYQVIGFDLGFQQNGTFIDEKTGQSKPVQDYVSFSFRASKPDTLWRNRIRAEMRPGDALFFDKVLVKDSKGNKYLSSPLHFVIAP
jgi:hypothetical protein